MTPNHQSHACFVSVDVWSLSVVVPEGRDRGAFQALVASPHHLDQLL